MIVYELSHFAAIAASLEMDRVPLYGNDIVRVETYYDAGRTAEQ